MTLLMHNYDPDDRHKSYEKTVKCEMKHDLGNKRQPDLISYLSHIYYLLLHIIYHISYKLPTSLNLFNFSGKLSRKSTGSARYSTVFNGIVP